MDGIESCLIDDWLFLYNWISHDGWNHLKNKFDKINERIPRIKM